jgi:glycosyltransferase involved in cell wall biosynthesis
MNILHLLPHFRNDGNGVVNAVVDLACTQSAAGHRVSCIGGDAGSFTELLGSKSVATYVVAAEGNNQASMLRSMKELGFLLSKIRPEVIHAHTIPSAIKAKVLKPFFDFRLVTTVHNGHRPRNVLLAVGDKVICVSAAVAQGMRSLHVPEAKLRVVRNGPLNSPRRSQSKPDNPQATIRRPAIVTIAGLHHYKGVQDLIEAFAIVRKSIPDLNLYILGRGPERPNLEAQSASLNCEGHIYFEGFVDDPRHYLEQAEVFVLPSRREAFGLALAEARESRCALVGTNVGGIPEVLEDGQAGILVPPGEPATMSEVLIKLLTDEGLRRHWQQRAGENLFWLRAERVSQETIEVYHEALRYPTRSRASDCISQRE